MTNRILAVGLACGLLAVVGGCRGGQAPPPQSPPPPQASAGGSSGEASSVRADREHLRELGEEAGEPTAAQPAAAAATQPAPGQYGAERFRLVNQKDEIVAVLDNGLT